eukprot:4342539-Ditylum_brightwellii.AAC.1
MGLDYAFAIQSITPIVWKCSSINGYCDSKCDENGIPKKAKYQIVAIRNLDPYSWTKEDCFTPAMSQLELCLIASQVVNNKCILKNLDIKQAFCQSKLPKEEKYVMKPPPECPLIPKDTYLLLLKMLYGLKRSPTH